MSLCSTHPKLYPRARWAEADLSTDDVGIMDAVHKLSRLRICIFVASFVKGSFRAQLLKVCV